MKNNYCCHSPWCEDDEVCRCEAFEKYEDEERKEKLKEIIIDRLMWVSLILCGGYIIIRIVISLVWKI